MSSPRQQINEAISLIKKKSKAEFEIHRDDKDGHFKLLNMAGTGNYFCDTKEEVLAYLKGYLACL